jgi:hypothetical protein
MGLIDRIAGLFRQVETKPARTTDAEMPAPGRGPLDLAGDYRAASDRRSVVKACRVMYESDPRGEAVISTLARDIVRGGFEVTFDEGAGAPARAQEEAKQIADDLVKRLDLSQRLDDWVRLSLRDGDSFLELSVDENLDIAAVTRKPTLEVRRNSNSRDGFDDPRRAFWQGDQWQVDPTADAVWFAQWQMIHARWAHDEGSRYGKPLFASATKPFKRMTEGETDIAVRRKTRAGMKYLHQFPQGTDRAVIEEYKLLNRDSIENPLAAIADFFGTVDIKTIAGDAQLGQIDDVMHHIRTWFLVSPVAMSLLGYGQDLNRDVLEKQSEQYQRALEGLTAWPEVEIVKPLIERQWLLKGIVPEGLGYSLKWTTKQVITAAVVEAAANAGLKLKAIGLGDEALIAVLGMLLPGVDLGTLQAAVSAASPTVPRDNKATPGRMARAADELAPAQRAGV